MKRLFQLMAAASACLIACTDADNPSTTDHPSADSDTADITGSGELADIAATPPGSTASAAALPQPSISYSGTSRVTVLDSGVRIEGDTATGAFALVRYDLPLAATHITAQLTIDAAPNAAFQYNLNGSGSGYSTKKITLQRLPGSDQLQAHSATGWVSCGALAKPATATLLFDGDRHTFDVQLDGAATACTNLSIAFQPPVVGISIMDPSNTGYGGTVQLTDLAVY